MSFSHRSIIPIELLPGIGSRTAKILQQCGIYTIGQFKQLPEALLIEMFGPSIRKSYRLVQGSVQAPTPIKIMPAKGLWQRMRFAQAFLSLL